VIPIIFTVNSSEFACFYFKSRESHERGSDCLCLLSPGGFRVEQFVTNCVGEHVPSS